MKRLILATALMLIAIPVFAQDEGGGGGFGGGLFGGGDTGGDAGGNARGGRNAAPPDRLIGLRQLMVKENTPLTAEEEKTLKPALEKLINQLADSLRKKYPEIAQQQDSRGNRGGGGFNGGGGGGEAGGAGRGGGRGGRGRGALPPDSPYMQDIKKMNEELLAMVTSKLTAPQQATLKKYEDDETRKGGGTGGFPAFRLNLVDILTKANTPLTADQQQQVDAISKDLEQQRTQLYQAAQGQEPDKPKLAQLDQESNGKLTKILTPDQTKALLAALKAQKAGQPAAAPAPKP